MLFDQISADIKAAMIARDALRLETLRGIKKEFLEAKSAKGSEGELSDEQAQKILQKMLKQRKDAAAIYQEQQRSDLADKELAEATIVSEYLPKPMDDQELRAALKAIIAQVGAQDLKDLGKVMGVASKQLAGKVEGRVLSETCKQLLS